MTLVNAGSNPVRHTMEHEYWICISYQKRRWYFLWLIKTLDTFWVKKITNKYDVMEDFNNIREEYPMFEMELHGPGFCDCE